MRKFKCTKKCIIGGGKFFSKGLIYTGDVGNDNGVHFINDTGERHYWNVAENVFHEYFEEVDSKLSAPIYYDNSKGSLYKVATERGWNPYLFDIVKRCERGGKKDPLRQEIEKSIFVLQLWLEEQDV